MQFKHLLLATTIIFIALVLLYVKAITEEPTHEHHKLKVVCTTNIIADALAHIAEEHIELHMLMGPGVDPHLYKPIEQDVMHIAQADIIFYNGLHLEARMADLFEQMSTMQPTISVCSDMPKDLLIRSEEHETYFDPHVWFDPKLWTYAIKTITKTLQIYDPTHQEIYATNSALYLKRIKTMYQKTKHKIAQIPKEQRFLITGHDAFEYFSRAYEIAVKSLQGISTASEAGTKDIQELANFIVNHKIPAIFIETSIPPRNIQAVQQNVASRGFNIHIGKELYSDALGSQGTPEGTYIGMINYNVNTIVNELTD